MKIAIVGCSRGIGEFLADSLEGPHAVLRISRTGTKGTHINADVTKWEDMIRCVVTCRRSRSWGFERLDALIYCAGTQGEIGPTLDADPDKWSQTIDTNLKGFFYSVNALQGLLDESPSFPRIIAFSGGGASNGRPNFSAYAASKAGLVRLVETLAQEKPRWKVNAIAPGSIRTRMTEEVIEAGKERAGTKEYEAALNTIQDPAALDRVLDLITFLLSPESTHISGRFIAAIHDRFVWNDPASFAGNAYLLRRVEPVRQKTAAEAKAV